MSLASLITLYNAKVVDLRVPLAKVLSFSVREDLARMKIVRPREFGGVSSEIDKKINEQFDQL